MEQQQTPSWGITPVPERLRVLGLFDLTLLWGNLSVSLLVIVAAAGLVPMLSLPKAVLANRDRGARRERVARPGGRDRCGRARAGDGWGCARRSAAAAPMRRRVLNVAQNLGWSTFELIIISTAAAALSERVIRLPGALALGAALRRDLARARAAGPDRLRPPLSEEVRRLGGRGLDCLPDLVGAAQGEPARALAPAGHRRGHALPGDRPRDRQHRLLDAARRRLLHPLPRADRRGAFLGNRDRVTCCRRSGASGSARCSCSRAT